MILPQFRWAARSGDTISTLYGAIVAQARAPAFYRDYAVADTVDGRFELILVHLALVLRRLAREETVRPLGQEIFDLFCTDMDRNLREMGISDLKVPKEMEKIGTAFYGRKAAYDTALEATADTALLEALGRNVYASSKEPPQAAARLAAYMRQTEQVLKQQDAQALLRGQLRFMDP